MAAIWAIKVVVERKIESQPLLAPLLSFLVWCGISCLFSAAPRLSWQRMGWFALLFVAIIVGQEVRTVRRIKLLILVLLLSTLVGTLRTGWQYFHGIGTELVSGQADNRPLTLPGLVSGDIIQAINGKPTRTLAQWNKALALTANDQEARLRFARGAPLAISQLTVNRKELDDWLRAPGNFVQKGRPVRAQGHFYHYIPYAGQLLVVALLVWGLWLTSSKVRATISVLYGIIFLAVSLALWATVTRAYLLSLVLSCFAVISVATTRRTRRLAVLIALLVLAGSTIWIEKERKMGWIAVNDPGTQFRLLMWKDAPRLIKSRPVVGFGLDSVFVKGQEWGLEAYKRYPLVSHFHSTYIQLAVDTGLPGFAIWIWLMAAYLVLLIRIVRKTRGAGYFEYGTALGAFGAALAFLLSCITHYILGDGEVMAIMWFLMGITVALDRILVHEQGSTLIAGSERFD
jgi:O-antigen ligase